MVHKAPKGKLVKRTLVWDLYASTYEEIFLELLFYVACHQPCRFCVKLAAEGLWELW